MPNYVSERESAQEKHKLRREKIVAAAAEVMRREGVMACTVRAVARRAGVSASTIHYYFVDVQELLDLGYARITDRYFGALEELRGTHADPVADFWHFLAAYIEPWQTHPRMGVLWSEYYTVSGTNQNLAGVAENHRRTIRLFAGALEPIEGGRHLPGAATLWRHLNGTIDSRHSVPVTLDELFGELAVLLGMARPDLAAVYCAQQDCWCRGGSPQLFPRAALDADPR